MTINILMNTDKNMIDACKVVINSILANTEEPVKFHIMGTVFKHDKANIIFYSIPNLECLPQIRQNGHITKIAVCRLFAPYIKTLDKVLYIDCDTVVLSDIKELWDIPVEYIKGVLDPMYISNAKKNNLGTSTYINSGVLLMNLKALREIPYFDMMKTQSHGYNLSLLDQDIINIAFKNYIELLPYEWNVYAKIYSETTQEMLEVRNNPKIIHWCGYEKPWNCETVWKREEWLKYAE